MQAPKGFTLKAHGVEMPVIGFGSLLLEEEGAADIVSTAIQSGYGHIDTARKYGTEKWVGDGIRASGIDRDELFITTKVTEENANEADFARSVEESLKTIGLDYVNLLLIHWPQPKVPLVETLGALAKAKRQGLARNIGVSNFTVALLDEAVRICPEPLVANQIEYHAYINQDMLLAACRRHGLIVTAHVPLARGKVVVDPVIEEIARGKGKSPAQIALRWLIQQPGVAAVPRTMDKKELAENIDVFDFSLSEDEMDRVSALRVNNLRVVDPAVRRPEWDEA